MKTDTRMDNRIGSRATGSTASTDCAGSLDIDLIQERASAFYVTVKSKDVRQAMRLDVLTLLTEVRRLQAAFKAESMLNRELVRALKSDEPTDEPEIQVRYGDRTARAPEDHTPFRPGELDAFLAAVDVVLQAREHDSTDSMLTLLRQARTNLGRLRLALQPFEDVSAARAKEKQESQK